MSQIGVICGYCRTPLGSYRIAGGRVTLFEEGPNGLLVPPDGADLDRHCERVYRRSSGDVAWYCSSQSCRRERVVREVVFDRLIADAGQRGAPVFLR